MNVCVVAPLHASSRRGYSIERYAFEVLNGLSTLGINTTCIDAGHRLERAEHNWVGRSVGMIYEGVKLLKGIGKFSIVHYSDPVVGIAAFTTRSVPVVTTVHEVPDALSHGARTGLGLQILRWACLNSDVLIADSMVTKEDLVSKLHAPKDRVVVVNLGVDPRFRPSKDKIRRKKTVGYIGAYYPRKNVRFLLEAYGIMCKNHPALDVQLELWGRLDEHAAEIRRLVKFLRLPNVHVNGFADEALLPDIYNSFDVFVFPSLKEGFGLPVLEAERCGVPTVLMKRARISPEVARASVLSANQQEMSDQILGLLTNEEYAREISRRGLEHSNGFTWERTVEGIVHVYQSLGVGQSG